MKGGFGDDSDCSSFVQRVGGYFAELRAILLASVVHERPKQASY